MKTSLGIKTILLCAALAAGQENYSQWSYFKSVTVNTKASGANVISDVSGFPVLIRFGLSDSLIFKQAGTNGASLRFTKSNGTTRLKHQIDQWDTTSRSGAVWVLADTVKGNDSTASMRLYWGKIGAADSSKGSSVFDTSNGFRSVWHLGSADTTARPNSVAGAPAARPTNFPAGYTPKAGIIGTADSLRGGTGNTTTDYLNMSSTGYTGFSDFTNFTVSAWVYSTHVPSQTFTGARFIELTSNGSPNGADRFYLSHNVATNGGKAVTMRWNSGTGTSNGVQGPGTGADTIEVGSWQHFMVTRSGTTTPVAYINGHTITTTAATTTTSTIPVIMRDSAYLGRSFSNTDPVFSGKMDEVTISTAARSADWVKLTYETQKATANALVLGTTQVTTVAPSGLDYSSDTAAYAVGIAITPNVASVTGIVDSFTVAPALPTGLTLNKTTGAITGTPTAITAAANYVLTAINGLGNAKDTLRLSVAAAPPIIAYTTPAPYTVGTAITALNVTSTGGSVTGYTISPALSAGLSFNTTSGAITGTPTAVQAATVYTIIATGTGGLDTATVSITVRIPVPVLVYNPATVTDSTTKAATHTPTLTGTVTSCTSTPTLPAGLTVNNTTCVISGTPTAITAAANYNIFASNSSGLDTAVINITVVSGVTAINPGSFVMRVDGNSKPYSFRLPEGAIQSTQALTLRVMDAWGRVVWSKTVNPAADKVSEISWNGKSTNGTHVSAGMYVVSILINNQGNTTEIVRKNVDISPTR